MLSRLFCFAERSSDAHHYIRLYSQTKTAGAAAANSYDSAVSNVRGGKCHEDIL